MMGASNLAIFEICEVMAHNFKKSRSLDGLAAKGLLVERICSKIKAFSLRCSFY